MLPPSRYKRLLSQKGSTHLSDDYLAPCRLISPGRIRLIFFSCSVVNVNEIASALLIASRASEARFPRCKDSAFNASNNGMSSIAPVARQSPIASSIQEVPSAISPEALRAQPRRTAPRGSQVAFDGEQFHDFVVLCSIRRSAHPSK
jgi:hypothetical protein